jgi:hypothetical protein
VLTDDGLAVEERDGYGSALRCVTVAR